MVTGKIRTLRVDKGFGFIKDETGKEYFFHQSAVYGEGLENLREGDSVEFDVGEGPKGPRARTSDAPPHNHVERQPVTAERRHDTAQSQHRVDQDGDESLGGARRVIRP